MIMAIPQIQSLPPGPTVVNTPTGVREISILGTSVIGSAGRGGAYPSGGRAPGWFRCSEASGPRAVQLCKIAAVSAQPPAHATAASRTLTTQLAPASSSDPSSTRRMVS
jgi:hypothetical protein